MKTKNTMTKKFLHEYMELDALKEYLEKQAADGWELTNVSGMTYGFRRCRPKTVKIDVGIIEDGDNEEDKEELCAFCEADGWKHIYDDGSIQYFEHKNLHAEPINNDPEIKLNVINRECIGRQYAAPLAIAGFGAMLWIFIKYSMDFYGMMQNRYIVLYYGLPTMLVLAICQAISYKLWYKKSKDALEIGREPVYRRGLVSKLWHFLGIFYFVLLVQGTILADLYFIGNYKGVIYFIAVVALVGVYGWVVDICKAAKNKSRKKNIANFEVIGICILILGLFFSSQLIIGAEKEQPRYDEMVLNLSDFGIETAKQKDYSVSTYGSFLLQEEEGYDQTYNKSFEELYYTLYHTKSKRAYDVTMDRYAEWYEEAWDPAFGADKVYYNDDASNWLLVYDDDILIVDASFTLTDKQKQVIVDKFVES